MTLPPVIGSLPFDRFAPRSSSAAPGVPVVCPGYFARRVWRFPHGSTRNVTPRGQCDFRAHEFCGALRAKQGMPGCSDGQLQISCARFQWCNRLVSNAFGRW